MDMNVALAPYPIESHERLHQEINAVVLSFPGAAVQTSNFVLSLEAGEEHLVAIGVVLPVATAGHTIQIPIEVCLPLQYPFVPPVTFLRPMPGTVVKQGHSLVSRDGQCRLPLQAAWTPSNSVMELLHTLMVTFAADIPIEDPRLHGPKNPETERLEVEQQRKAQVLAKAQGLHEQYASLTNGEVNRMLEMEAKLRSNAAQLEQRASYLVQDVEKVGKCVSIVEEKNLGLDAWLSEQQQQLAAVLVDDLAVARDPLAKQQLDAVAEDEAVQDCIFVLTRAFQRGELAFDVYMKTVRQLCRQQFNARALASKILSVQHGV